MTPRTPGGYANVDTTRIEPGIAVIGGGRIGRLHALNLAQRVPGIRLAGIADPFAGSELTRWAENRGIAPVIQDYHHFLTDPSVEALVICSPTDTHAEITREAAAAGRHVFCEKPLDRNPDIIRRTLKHVKDRGVVFQIGFNRRFDHNFRALKAAVDQGAVGDIHLLRITSRDPEPPPPEYVKSSGGLFVDMSIHDFDMARFLSSSEVVKVHAAGAVLVDPAIGEQGDIDTAIITLWFENGAMGVIENSRRAVYGYDQRAEVFGSGGSALCGNDRPSSVVISDTEGTRIEKPHHFFLERYAESFAEEMRCFAAGIRGASPTPHDGPAPVPAPGPKAALNSILIAQAAGESRKTGRRVDVPQA